MCGIAGILKSHNSKVNATDLRRMTERMSHRGPDGSGFHVDDHIGLGHRRLAIIDLEGGKQPMSNEDETVWIAFNGEIYNFKELRAHLKKKGHLFKTRSDTEVLIHGYEEWGVDCLSRLRGMFAFGLWDARTQRLLLARDRIGIKPLCYYASPEIFAFASELQAFKALKGFQPTIDLEALDLYLHFQYIPAPFSIYREVKKLPPAHYMIVDSQGNIKELKRYWDIQFNPNYKLKEDEWIECLDAELRETIKIHLISDVPFGAFLSGGVDSSTVIAYMSQVLENPVRTFTIGYEDSEYDERAFAIQASSALGTDHYEKVVQPDALELLPKLVEHYGEPFADSSAIATYYVSQTARQYVKMVLSGDGGDETFAGYDYFSKMLRHHPKPKGYYRKIRRYFGNLARSIGIVNKLPSHQETWYNRSPYFNNYHRKNLWHPDFHYLLSTTQAWNNDQFEPVKHADLLSQCQYVDIHNYLPFDNLNKVDIASMCHGLEVRVPLLDHKLLELVATIPPKMKIRPTTTNLNSKNLSNVPASFVGSKYILKKMAEQFFPSDFLNRSKMGFSLPISSWFANSWHIEFRDKIRSSSNVLGELFNLDYVSEMIQEHGTKKDHGLRLWSLLFLAEWIEQNRFGMS